MTGTVVGIVPGVGGTVAGFVSYGQAMQFGRKTRARFGKGDIRGLIAPEAAMDAKDGGSLIPALAFGLPGSEGGILLLAMFAIHGITPGRDMFGPHLDFTFTLVLALLLSNILTSVVGVALTPLLSRISNFRIDRLALPLFVVTAITMVQMEGQVTHLFVTIIFGLLAYLFARFDWPRVPFLIAFILGDLIEVNLNLTGQLMAVGRIVPYERPVAIFIAVIILATLAWMLRRTAFRDKTRPDTLPDDVLFPSFLLLGVGAMTVTAILYPGPQTGFTAAVLALALTTLGLVAGRAWRRQLVTGKGLLPSGLLEPANLVHPITLIALLPLVATLVGLHLGLAALTFFWIAGPRDVTPRNIARAALWALIAAASSWGLLVGWAHYYLPTGLLLSLLTGG